MTRFSSSVDLLLVCTSCRISRKRAESSTITVTGIVLDFGVNLAVCVLITFLRCSQEFVPLWIDRGVLFKNVQGCRRIPIVRHAQRMATRIRSAFVFVAV